MDAQKQGRVGTPGWRQILSAKDELLNVYDVARVKTSNRKVKVGHGHSAEAIFRAWLSEFLPKRYGVTAGFVLSQRPPFQGWDTEADLPHFDVIIYDQLDSPILWVDGNADVSPQGRARAIPVEHIRGILEIKATLTSKSAREVIGHLRQLTSFWEAGDTGSRHRCFLPMTTFCGAVFFELRKDAAFSAAAIDSLLPPYIIRSQFIGGLILRGAGLDPRDSGHIQAIPMSPRESNVGKGPLQVPLTSSDARSRAQAWGGMGHCAGFKVTWDYNSFGAFAFELIAHLNGTYNPHEMPSLFGRSWQMAPEPAQAKKRPTPRKVKGKPRSVT